ncbi:EscU/YscU/HrcU family type III secretion system export apparatus switch protein [Parerythrobacter jejuensis]|uniref:Flagellar type III secretion system protein FlhB n=1 Tax=Parerythrobacter jejuensis TaxID=795812 RepID=A0A845AVV8_9SPHN|nr:EscU/YscU/HrcU family type III secretion system export apparatus switch protein [Parerythrobacter jejuensis]MXP30553.1 flagellar type III secretion system protein FlhB [Parerythrobacter jejuensis]MXP33313.1 flagellar type III secretion system protein FlhB [Parerythrobacter jejuensis]
MSEEGQEQNKTEEPTPFKLKKAREKGQVARGMDLGFVGSLIAVAGVAMFMGETFFGNLADIMRYSFAAGITGRGDPMEALGVVAETYWGAFQPLVILGAVIMIVLITLEILQLRGFVWSTHPLKPDFKKLNPAKGLKKIFSMKMLKETLKNITKFFTYCTAAGFIGYAALETWGVRLVDAQWLVRAMEQSGARLLMVFIGFAFVFMVIDQIIVRREFHKQMRMSRRELTRETKDREGEPRFKQKRKEIHQQMREQSEGLGKLPGSDLLVVNPEHYAVALRYDAKTMSAPEVRVKGRNHFAQLMKRKARLHAVPVVPNPPLARKLYAECSSGGPIRPDHYHEVARLYRALANPPAAPVADGQAAVEG